MQANEIYAEVMDILQKAIADKSTTYADIFGAIELTKTYIVCEHSMQLNKMWSAAEEIRTACLNPEIKIQVDEIRNGAVKI